MDKDYIELIVFHCPDYTVKKNEKLVREIMKVLDYDLYENIREGGKSILFLYLDVAEEAKKHANVLIELGVKMKVC